MNVYKVDDYWIAAKDPEHALSQYMEEKDNLDDIFIGDLEEGEEYEISTSIKRITTKAMNVKSVPCCSDGCSECEDKDENVYYSFQELIDKKEEKDFPCVLAIEE